MIDESLRMKMEEAYLAGEYTAALELSAKFDEQVLAYIRAQIKKANEVSGENAPDCITVKDNRE